LPRYNFPLIDRAHVFAIDNQAEAHFDTGVVQHTVLMGVDYLRSRNDYRSGFGSAPSIDIFDPVYGAPLPAAPFTTHTDNLLEQMATRSTLLGSVWRMKMTLIRAVAAWTGWQFD
jgi:iron complex outermembrane recepter protein